jgi:hypothetical protein
VNRHLLALTFALAGAPLALAQLDPLPAPLTLPPGMVQVLPINHDVSYMADAVRIVDCPLKADNPFGTCGNVLFGGFAMFASQLSGLLQIQFFQPSQGIAHFEITHPGDLVGDDVPMVAPQFFSFQTQQNRVFDAFQQVSSGDLNLQTGEVTNLLFAVNMFNTFYQAFGNANPRFKLQYFQFPGAYGSAWANFTQRSDGLLNFEFHASTFLPLGNQQNGAIPRIPLPFCSNINGTSVNCANIQAPGTSFRPSINISTAPTPDPLAALPGLPNFPPCGNSCLAIPDNTVQAYANHTSTTFFHEGFTMNVPNLGGAIGRTHWDGRTIVQFGQRTGDLVPVFFELLTPAGTIGIPAPIKTTLPLPAGLTPGFIGKDIVVHFPLLTYFPQQMSYSTDPFDGSRGLLNVKTGQFVDRLMFSGFLVHNLLLRVIEFNEGRIPVTPFLTRGAGSFVAGPRGEAIFRFAGLGYRNYTGFLFPMPDLMAADTVVAGPGSRLDPHLYIQAAQPAPDDTPGPGLVMKTGSYNVVTPTGDPVTMSYSVPCNANGQNGTFDYANTGSILRSGSFHMQNLIYVNCTNSPTSTAGPGDFDTITFAGIGLWSGDPQQLDPHVASVHVNPNTAQGPYFSVLIDGGYLSNADLKPPIEPVP